MICLIEWHSGRYYNSSGSTNWHEGVDGFLPNTRIARTEYTALGGRHHATSGTSRVALPQAKVSS